MIKETSYIYILTLCHIKKDQSNYYTHPTAFSMTFEGCEEMLMQNSGDFLEHGYYSYALIEKVPSDCPYCLGTEEMGWYATYPSFNESTKRVYYNIMKCDKPKYFENTINFGMG